jgi:hypothetical protein
VHRDVKPANILIDVRAGRPDHVYLADFGLTKTTTGAIALTSTGRFLGTADYASPEQIAGRRVDGRADQYALACAAVEMLTGQTPFPLENAMAVLTAHMSKSPPPASARRYGLPPEIDAVLGRALAKSPSDRYRSCGDFAAALQRAAGVGQYEVRAKPAATTPLALPRSVEPHGGVERVRRRNRRGGRPMIAASAVAVAAAVVVFLILAQPRRAPGPHSAGTGHTPSGRAASAPRWHTYDGPSGFAIGMPPGWAVASTTPGEVRFTGTPGGFVLVVAWSTHPQSNALADWQQQAAAKAAADSSYRQISIRRVSYRGYNAADWQFTNIYQGIRIRAIDRTFIVRPGQLSYAIELYGPAGQWLAVYASMWHPLVSSFQPAP